MRTLCLAVGCLIAGIEAHTFTTAKMLWMQSKGVNLNEVYDSKANMHARAAKIDKRVKMSHNSKLQAYNRHLNGQDGDDAAADPEAAAAEQAKQMGYMEELTYGLIDGTTADFNGSCRDAMKMTVNGAFRVYSYKSAYKPSNFSKAQLALNQFMSGWSNTYAYCDFTAFYGQLATLSDFDDYEQYVTLASRVMGSFISTIPTLKACVKQGKAGGLGYDVGLCRGKMITTLLDVTL